MLTCRFEIPYNVIKKKIQGHVFCHNALKTEIKLNYKQLSAYMSQRTNSVTDKQTKQSATNDET